jgi:hypothetical protein
MATSLGEKNNKEKEKYLNQMFSSSGHKSEDRDLPNLSASQGNEDKIKNTSFIYFYGLNMRGVQSPVYHNGAGTHSLHLK